MHYRSLDGLRGIAVILVVLDHINLDFGGPLAPRGVDHFLAVVWGAGWIGVDLFFTLSGFLITNILVATRGDEHYFRNFYARRSLRIMPLYFGYLAVCLAVILAAKYGVGRGASSFPDDSIPSLFFYYYNFWSAITGKYVFPFHHFWSLSVEEHFYLLWPALIYGLNSRQLKFVCIVGVGCSLLLRLVLMGQDAPYRVEYLVTPCRLDGLLLGSFVALCYRPFTEGWLLRRAWPAAILSALTLAGICLWQGHFYDFLERGSAGSKPADSYLTLTLGLTALAVFFSSVIAILVDAENSGKASNWLTSRLLQRTGKYSYAIYIFHIVVLFVVVRPLDRYTAAWHWPDWVLKPLAATLAFGVSFALAAVSYHYFERYFLLLKRHFEPTGGGSGTHARAL